MQLFTHGGFCCGMRHIQGFYKMDVADYPAQSNSEYKKMGYKPQMVAPFAKTNREEFDRIIAHFQTTKCLEVVLNDHQVASDPSLVPLLKEKGFRLVSRFNNQGSSWCNVFHLVTNPNGSEGKLPSRWADLETETPDWWKDTK